MIIYQAVSQGKPLGEECQHFLWTWKNAQTKNPSHQEKVKEACEEDMVKIVTKGLQLKIRFLVSLHVITLSVFSYSITANVKSLFYTLVQNYGLAIDPKFHWNRK